MTRNFLLAAIAAILSLAPASAAPPADLDAFVGKAMREFEVPGMAIAIVEGDQAFAKGHGVRRLGEAAPVDAHSLFSIGSTTKAFTAAAAAILVSEGKLRWDDVVADRLPGFRMQDPRLTRTVTLRDTLSHRTGLASTAGELLYYPSTNHTRPEILHRIRYLKPDAPLRSRYAYNNIGYVIAGETVAAVAGQSWEEFVAQRILAPLGMTDTAVSLTALRARPSGFANLAWPHTRVGGSSWLEGTVRPLRAPVDDDNVAAAGSIYASASDLTRWMMVQLDQGRIRGSDRRLYGEAEAREMWTPQIDDPQTPARGLLAVTTPRDASYALGWHVQDYRGHRLVMHTGASVGARAAVAFIPEKGVGIWVMINSDDGGARLATLYRLLDHYLGVPEAGWIPAYLQFRADMAAEAARSAVVPSAPATAVPMEDLAGRYCDPAYGTITVDAVAGAPRLRFDRTPFMVSALDPVGKDLFRTRFPQTWFEDAIIRFARDGSGKVRRITMRSVQGGESNYSDLLFRPVASGRSCGD